MRWTVSGILLASLVAAHATAAPFQAQDSDVEGAAPIVVTGERVSPQGARRLATEFVGALGVASGHQPAARWEEPICPRAIGLAPGPARIVEDVVRAAARDAGARIASASCTANIVISFSADAGATVRAVQAQAPSRLREVRGDARTVLLTGSAPVRWWYATENRNSDGTSGQVPGMVGALENGQGGSQLSASGDSGSQRLYNSSMISTRAVRVIRSASVVIDVGRSHGVPLQAVANYAALVALAEIRPQVSPPDGSILRLFQEEVSTDRLTTLDRSFLRGLYRMPLDRGGRQHRSYLRREVTNSALGMERPPRQRNRR